MTDEIIVIKKSVVVVNKLGVHIRAAEKLVRLAKKYNSTIILQKGPKEADAKSIMDMVTLAAKNNSKITITIEGDDAEEAMHALCELIANKFGEAE